MEKATPNRSPLPKLHTGLLQLESELYDLFRLSSTNPPNHTNRHLFNDVFKRIEFLKNLYNAEVNTSPDLRNNEELNQIWERIVKLENRFGEWYEQGESSQDNVDENASSVCGSCNCKFSGEEEDDRRESVSSVSPRDDSQPSVQEELLIEAAEKGVEEEAVVETGRRWTGIWSRCGAFVSGVLVGAIGVVMCLSSDDFSEQAFLLLPPT